MRGAGHGAAGSSPTAPAADVATPRDRVLTALAHRQPDRIPVDFVAAPEVWDKLTAHFGIDTVAPTEGTFFEPAREEVLRRFEVDCRLLSYDMFCAPPEDVLHGGSRVDWWGSRDRSTPNRMWRQVSPDGTSWDIWGAQRRTVRNKLGAYEEFVSFPLARAERVSDLGSHPWPHPDWWDFQSAPEVVRELDRHGPYHLRFRIGSVFEVAWQLRGMQQFLMDLVTSPEIPRYIMSRLTEVHLENTRRVMELLAGRLDMVYLYDDVGAQNGLMISPGTWQSELRPYYANLVALAHSHGLPVMYHCDGAIRKLIPRLIDLGINVLNPIQPNVQGMEPEGLKREFGDALAFHGGVDIVELLPHGSVDEVAAAVRHCGDVLGREGGYILCSAHHLQPDTPVENIEALYDVALRYGS